MPFFFRGANSPTAPKSKYTPLFTQCSDTGPATLACSALLSAEGKGMADKRVCYFARRRSDKCSTTPTHLATVEMCKRAGHLAMSLSSSLANNTCILSHCQSPCYVGPGSHSYSVTPDMVR